MIGFFQNSMAKHHKLMFGVLLVFIVVSFVFYTGSGSVGDLLGVRRSSKLMGIDLTNSEALAPYRAGTFLSSSNRRITSRDVFERIFLVKTAEAYQIPEPTQAQLTEFLAEQGFTAQIIAAVERNYDISEDVLRTALIHSWKIRRFLQIFGNVPAVFESDVELFWKEINTSWKVDFATFDMLAADIEARTPSDAQLAEFYEKNKESFRIGELMKFSYAKLVPAADAIEKIADPTDFELRAFAAEKNNGSTEAADAAIASDRAALVAAWKKSQALDSAAAEFSNTLYEKLPTDTVNPRRDDFAEILEKSGLGFSELPAFPRDKIPADAPVPAEILASVVDGLNDTLWRTDAIPSGDAVYVVLLRGTEPSRIPALDEIKAELSAAWIRDDRETQFVNIARVKGEALSKAVADGKAFSQAATELGFKTVSPDAFTIRDVPDEFSSADVVGLLKLVPDGEISPMFMLGNDRAAFAKTVSTTVPALDKNSESFKSARQIFDRRTSWETFQMQLALLITKLSVENGISADGVEE